MILSFLQESNLGAVHRGWDLALLLPCRPAGHRKHLQSCWEIVPGRLLHRHQEGFLQEVAQSLSPRGRDGADWVRRSLRGGGYPRRNVGSQRGCSTAQGRPECGWQGRKELKGLGGDMGAGGYSQGTWGLNHPFQSLCLAFPVSSTGVGL